MQYVGYIVPDHPFDPDMVKEIREDFRIFAQKMQLVLVACPIAAEGKDPSNTLEYGRIDLPVYNTDLDGYYPTETVHAIRTQFKTFADEMLEKYFSGAPENYKPDLVESGYLGHSMRCIEDARNAIIEAVAYIYSQIDVTGCVTGWISANQVGVELRKAKDAFVVAATRRKHQLTK